jgi:hypothetical protein
VIVPLRWPSTLTATVKDTDPFPRSLAPDVMVIHEALLIAVQLQLPIADTEIEPDPPRAGIDWLVGLIEPEHDCGGAAA